MTRNRKSIAVLAALLFAAISFSTMTGFSDGIISSGNGSIEGYVLPKEAKPRVELILPHPKKAGDTIHKMAVPNAAGYFKFNNVPAGTHELIYYPKEPAMYRSVLRTVDVTASRTARIDTVRLERQ